MVFYGLMILLPLSALIARRPPPGQTLRMAAAWVGIFAIGLVLVSQRDRLPSLNRLLDDQEVSGTETRIGMAEDGHFHAVASINGVRAPMLVDSGATTIALSVATAKAAGLDLNERAFPVMIDTANGRVVARRVTIKSLKVGSVTVSDIAAVVSEAFGDQDIIGMNFLSRLVSWRVEGRTLILQPNKT
ncbi:hypothetical protein ASG07_04770 [Sphingomonas sp. Leaf343]|nr:hypothetical protein ASG07_04770 [Sphingomonas sp. Leaf343]